MNRDEFIKGWKLLEGNFGHQSPDRADAVWLAVKGWTKDEWAKAVILAITSVETFPTTAKICGMRPGQVSKKEKAIQAWEHVWSEKNNTGPYNPHHRQPHGRNVEPIALKAIGGVGGLIRLYEQQEDPESIEYMKGRFLTEYMRLLDDDSRDALYLDAPSTKSFAERGGVRSLGEALDKIVPIESIPLKDNEKELGAIINGVNKYRCRKHGVMLQEDGSCKWCNEERAKEAAKQKQLGCARDGLEDPRR